MTVCAHKINSNFLNRCTAIRDAPTIRTVIPNIFAFIYPAHILSILAILIFLLPFVFSLSSRQSFGKTLRLYNVVRFTILSLFQLIGYSLHLTAILRWFIRQPAPCDCQSQGMSNNENFNMPYFYTVGSVSIALYVFKFKKFDKVIAYFASIFIGVVPNIFYILTGWASIGQVLFSALLGSLLYLFASRTNNIVVIIENVIYFGFLIGIFLYILVNRLTIYYRFSIQILRGILISIYEIYEVLAFSKRTSWSYLNINKGVLLIEYQSEAIRSSLLEQEDEGKQYYEALRIDKRDGAIGLLICIAETMIEEALNKM